MNAPIDLFKDIVDLKPFKEHHVHHKSIGPRKDFSSHFRNCKLFTIDNFLSEEECLYYISSTEKIGYSDVSLEYNKDYRNCERLLCQCDEFSNVLWNRLFIFKKK